MGGARGRITSTADRMTVIELVSEAKREGAREIKACQEIGISLRTLQRWRKEEGLKGDKRPTCKRPTPKNKLAKEEETQILEVINEPKYQSMPPSQIVPALADAGVYIASESTMYRVMREAKQQNHRGQTKKSVSKPKATHCATTPNSVWSWDITYLSGPIKGIFLYLYMIMDIFSRKIVGWEVWEEENTENASHLIRRSVMAEKLIRQKEPLVLHSDNGSPMKGATMLETLYQLGITPSRSRPGVSNDNPYSESLFKTCKYTQNYPTKAFKTLDEARTWVKGFVYHYNYEHHHSGIKFLTPNQRHSGEGKKILERRQQVYKAAKENHPERWSRKTRDWTLEDKVWLNPEKAECSEKEKKQSNAS